MLLRCVSGNAVSEDRVDVRLGVYFCVRGELGTNLGSMIVERCYLWPSKWDGWWCGVLIAGHKCSLRISVPFMGITCRVSDIYKGWRIQGFVAVRSIATIRRPVYLYKIHMTRKPLAVPAMTIL